MKLSKLQSYAMHDLTDKPRFRAHTEYLKVQRILFWNRLVALIHVPISELKQATYQHEHQIAERPKTVFVLVCGNLQHIWQNIRFLKLFTQPCKPGLLLPLPLPSQTHSSVWLFASVFASAMMLNAVKFILIPIFGWRRPCYNKTSFA